MRNCNYLLCQSNAKNTCMGTEFCNTSIPGQILRVLLLCISASNNYSVKTHTKKSRFTQYLKLIKSIPKRRQNAFKKKQPAIRGLHLAAGQQCGPVNVSSSKEFSSCSKASFVSCFGHDDPAYNLTFR